MSSITQNCKNVSGCFQNAAVFSRGIRRIQHFNQFFPEWKITRPNQQSDCVLGWGLRPTTRRARQFADKHQLPFIALEDGFIRSLGLGVLGSPPLSLVWDDVGIYYDTAHPSRLENLILAANLSDEEYFQAEQNIQFILNNQISKYNHAPNFSPEIRGKNNIVLLIDQTYGDMAIQYGGADETTFAQMFQAACAENPTAEIWIKTHPDVLSGKKRGYFGANLSDSRVRILSDDCNPISLLKQIDKVYCATSQMGFEALLCGKSVVVFGRAWYAGWGLTDDRHPDIAQLQRENRRAPRDLATLFFAAYQQYPRYLNPHSGVSGNLNDVLAYLAHQKKYNELLHGEIYAIGFSLWKQDFIRQFLHFPACRLRFVRSVDKLPETLSENAKLLVWSVGKSEILNAAEKYKIAVLRMEDGFIRSVGLGSNLVPPLSLVVDNLGIYFDERQPSRLENILQNHQFNTEELFQAAQIREKLVAQNISKYNVGDTKFSLPETAHDKRVLLVIGQVEDDASIRFGSPRIKKNSDLLRLVRERNPDAFVIYKPHPDVVSGNRVGKIERELTDKWADWTAEFANISDCLNASDEVHTMTSLTGFEALLRGKMVCCYGSPFYAHWGLTRDEYAMPRRSRRLSLDELVCGTLLHYPLYLNPNFGEHTNALTVIEMVQRQKNLPVSLKRSVVAKQFEKLRQLLRLLKSP